MQTLNKPLMRTALLAVAAGSLMQTAALNDKQTGCTHKRGPPFE